MDTSILGQAASMDAEQDTSASLLDTRDSYRPVAQLPVGACLQGKYSVLGVLGHGGFAVVYDAEHMGLGRRVAIKVLHVGDDTPVGLIERFRREARISALVNHPNVLEVYDTGQLPCGSPFLVMERVNGENLSTMIRRGPLSLACAIEVGRQLLLGLAAIADAGIVHRDVKPDNIMLHDAGDGVPTVKLVDFGISRHISIEPQAKLTCHGALVGTPQYMSPEQIRGEEVDARSDIYAAGAVLYEALAGQAPHASDNFSELVVAVLNNQVRPLAELRPNCPAQLSRIILAALARSRAQRYASPRHMLEALEEFACLFELPRGADAFRATDREVCSAASSARSSTPGTPKLWGFGWREAKLPLQVACVAMLVGAPKLLSLNQSTVDSQPGLAVRATRQIDGAMDPLTGALATSTALSRALALPGTATSEAADEALAPFAASGMDTLLAAGREQPERLPLRKRKLDRTAAGNAAERSPAGVIAPNRDKPSPAAAESSSEAAHAPSGEQRAKWEATMQTALSPLVRDQLAQAQEAYAAAVKLAPREATGFRGLGLVSARLGDAHAARVALKRYLQLAPRADDADAITVRLAALPN